MNFTFTPATEADYPAIVAWLKQPHVARWWRDPAPTLEAVKEHYGDRVAGNDTTSLYIAHLDGRAIGIIQSYWYDDCQENGETIELDLAVGVDLFIGEPDAIGKGYGPELLKQFITKVIRPNYAGAEVVTADPEVANPASIGAFMKAGFTKGAITPGEHGPKQIMLFQL